MITHIDLKDQRRLLAESGLLKADWYHAQYPDVKAAGMTAAEHYLRYGAAMGRDPGPGFGTTAYLREVASAENSGVNPAVHYHVYGRKVLATPPRTDPDNRKENERRIQTIKAKLEGLGLTEPALAELRRLADDASNPDLRSLAIRELISWNMRTKTDQGFREALALIALTRALDVNKTLRHDRLARLATLEQLCHVGLGQTEAGEAAFLRAGADGVMSTHTILAHASLMTDLGDRITWINLALREFGIEPVALLPEVALPYDRLTVTRRMPETDSAAAKVTVLLAVYNAADTLPTALRSLLGQTWRNLEILVIDDCSTDATVAIAERHAAADRRIRVIRMATNGGAYVARNRALTEATGDFVTIHDGDDWSHPAKIATQAQFLLGNADVMGCMSQQARSRNDLSMTRWTGTGNLIITNVSSFMFRRVPVTDALGFWDTVRFAADSEFVRRVQAVFGEKSVKQMLTGPLSFQRDSDTSVVADEVMGINGFYFGVRKEYFDAQTHHHTSGASLRYDGNPASRPFPLPVLIRTDRAAVIGAGRHRDVIHAGDFRALTPAVEETIAAVAADRAAGRTVGIVEVFDYALNVTGPNRMHRDMRALVDGDGVQVLTFGEDVACNLLLLRGRKDDLAAQRYVPVIRAAETREI